jgi:hypothetical protein
MKPDESAASCHRPASAHFFVASVPRIAVLWRVMASNKLFFSVLCLAACLAAWPLEAQKAPAELVPGVPLPMGGLAYALDTVGGKPTLLPIKHHDVFENQHGKSNFARDPTGWGMSKGHGTVELADLHSPLQLQTGNTILLAAIFSTDLQEGASDGESASRYHLIRLQTTKKDTRVVHKLEFSRSGHNAKRLDDVVDSTITRIPGTTWLKIVPLEPLPPGEYAIEPIWPQSNGYTISVYDFGVGQPAGSDSAGSESAK